MELENCVITRIQFLELPFIDSFIEWYLNIIKFDKIIFLIYDKNFNEITYKYLNDLNNDKIIIMDNTNDLDDVNEIFTLQKNMELIQKFEWCLNIDIDEFLFLNGTTIKDFLFKRQKNYNGFFFNRIEIYNLLFLNSLSEIINSTDTTYCPFLYGKSLFKPKYVKYYDPHDYEVIKNKQKRQYCLSYKADFYIAHFTCRSIIDVYLKSVYQDLPKCKSYNSYKKNNFYKSNNYKLTAIPNRLLTTNIIYLHNINDFNQKPFIKQMTKLDKYIKPLSSFKYNLLENMVTYNFNELMEYNIKWFEYNEKNIQIIFNIIRLERIKFILKKKSPEISHYEILGFIQYSHNQDLSM